MSLVIPDPSTSSDILISLLVIESYSGRMNSSGKFSPPLICLLLLRNCARVILSRSFSCGLCWFVFSMISENARTNAASSSAKQDRR